MTRGNNSIFVTLTREDAETLLPVVMCAIQEAHEYLEHPALIDDWLVPVRERMARLSGVAHTLSEALKEGS